MLRHIRYAVHLYALQLDSIRFVSSNSDFFHMNNLQETNNNNNFMKCCDLIPMKLDEFVVICCAFSLFFLLLFFCFFIRQWSFVFATAAIFILSLPISPLSTHQLALIFHPCACVRVCVCLDFISSILKLEPNLMYQKLGRQATRNQVVKMNYYNGKGMPICLCVFSCIPFLGSGKKGKFEELDVKHCQQ